jgi:DNA-binding MarR family transcriptional regulator
MTSTLGTDQSGTTTGSPRPVGAARDLDEAALAARLRLAVTRLHRCLRQQADAGLTPSQASALAGVEQLGSPTLGALAAREAVQPPSMTRIVGGLEALGHVTRIVDASDRRVARITITPSGEAVLRHIRTLKNAFLAERVADLEPAERAALGDLTALLERLVDGDDG